jgi:hypothetical protein
MTTGPRSQDVKLHSLIFLFAWLNTVHPVVYGYNILKLNLTVRASSKSFLKLQLWHKFQAYYNPLALVIIMAVFLLNPTRTFKHEARWDERARVGSRQLPNFENVNLRVLFFERRVQNLRTCKLWTCEAWVLKSKLRKWMIIRKLQTFDLGIALGDPERRFGAKLGLTFVCGF